MIFENASQAMFKFQRSEVAKVGSAIASQNVIRTLTWKVIHKMTRELKKLETLENRI